MPRRHQNPPRRPGEHAAAPSRPLYRRVPWTALVITIVVLLSAAFDVAPIRDAATYEAVPIAHLARSSGYVAIAPVSDVLDTLTLFTVRQHVALLLWVIVLYAAYRVWRGRRRESAGRRAAWELGYAALFLLVLVCVYALGALAPRPMAALVIDDPAHAEVLAVDFHSHTHYSHDGRRGWTADDVRAWHRGAGFDVAYVSDHASFTGAEEGIAGDPPEAGEGTMLLQAIEAFYDGEHVNVLGAGRRYKGLVTPDLKDVDDQTLALASALRGAEPVMIETLPGDLKKLTPARGPGTAGVRAIELVDGAPRGLQQTRLEHDRIVRLADSLNLALVAGSDNHGWGRTAPAWTLLDVPGWRGMAADSLEAQIEGTVRAYGRGAAHVVERVVADPGRSTIALVFAPWAAAWRMLTTLSVDERVMWLIWTWVIVIAARAIAMRRRPAA